MKIDDKPKKNSVPDKMVIFKEPVKTSDRAGEMAKTTDGFTNFGARIGLLNDNLISQGFYDFNLITRNRVQLEAAYRGSWISRKLIDIPAEDMTRAGIDITSQDNPEDVTKLTKYMSELQIWQSLSDTIKWGGLYGGAIAVMQIRGAKLDTPLDPDTIGKGQFLGLAVYDRWQLNPDLTEVIDSGPEIGLPKFYNIVTTSAQTDPSRSGEAGFLGVSNTGQIRVHHSRCIRIGGNKLPFFQAITEMMWDESVLETLWDRLIAFDTAAMSAAGLITRANLRTVSVEGLREILAAGGPAQEALESMFEMLRRMQSNEGLSLIDKNDEMTSTAYSFAGLSDLLLIFAQHLSGATDIPLIRLFSQSPQGMNATGESDLRLYYDGINARQNSKLRNPIHVLIRIMWQSLFGKPAPKDIDFTFSSLWQMTPTDKATVTKSDAETVIGAYDAGLTTKECTLKELRQNSKKTGLFTNITDEDIADAKEEDENPPDPEITENVQPGANSQAEAPPKIKKLSGDSAWKRISKWVAGIKK